MANGSAIQARLPRFRIPLSKVDFGNLGFRLDRPAAREVLETISRSHVTGFNLASSRWHDIHEAMAEIPEDQRGVSYEGAALYASLLDLFTAGRTKALDRLLAGPGDRYFHLIHVGAGWL
ncbi:MAG: DUF1702 family protein, partial [Mycobacteriales bacterium]